MSVAPQVNAGALVVEDAIGRMRMQQLEVIGLKEVVDEDLQVATHVKLAAIDEPVHTITLYLGAARSSPLIDEIVAAKPQRIILNPGAENEELAAAASGAGIEVVEGCTLVMLRTGLF